ncbi:dehydrogenase [Lithospermum erythrorhizon]|uniref:Dehydrogenase n=1 Tax=Lithospermum erythrorhizon TaxID=34254 RepID=A0AAV3R111_LITER
MNTLTSTKSTTTTTSSSSTSLYSLHRFSTTNHRNLPIHKHHQFQQKPKSLKINAIDAAQPFDYESQISNRFIQSTKLKIAIVGFGNFGQFLAKAFIHQGHTVFAHSRTDYSDAANSIGATFFLDPHDLCENHPDVILLCTSIISTKQVLLSLPVQRLKRNTLFVDVLSVKEFPRNLFLDLLPAHFDILCTHPMFGPESGKESWTDLAFVFDKVRIGNENNRVVRVERFLDIFKKEGCRMVEMSCAEHDRYAAGSQFITHTMGRVLEKLNLQTTPINTKGYETLLDLVDNTSSDSFDLYYGLFMYNEKAMEELQRLGEAFEELKMQLFGHLHELNRNQLFGKQSGREKPYYSKLKRSGAALPSPPSSNGALPAPASSSSSNGAAVPAQPSSQAQAPSESVGSRVN